MKITYFLEIQRLLKYETNSIKIFIKMNELRHHLPIARVQEQHVKERESKMLLNKLMFTTYQKL